MTSYNGLASLIKFLLPIILTPIITIFLIFLYDRIKERMNIKKQKKELKKALDYEISENRELVSETHKLIDRYRRTDPLFRKEIIFIPLSTDVWKSIINKGALLILGNDEEVKDLIKLYRLTDEINVLMDKYKIKGNIDVINPLRKNVEGIQEIYLPAEISNTIERFLEQYGKVKDILSE